MIEVNEYFEGKVKSLGYESATGKKTVGVMKAGEYEFNTTSSEIMTVVTGEISVYFPEDDDWEEFGKGSSFDVPANSSFKVKVSEDTAYLCEYVDAADDEVEEVGDADEVEAVE